MPLLRCDACGWLAAEAVGDLLETVDLLTGSAREVCCLDQLCPVPYRDGCDARASPQGRMRPVPADEAAPLEAAWRTGGHAAAQALSDGRPCS